MMKLPPRLLRLPVIDEIFRDFEPGGEMPIILLGKSRSQRRQDLVNRKGRFPIAAEMPLYPGVGAIEVGYRLRKMDGLAVIAVDRAANGDAGMFIVARHELGLGQGKACIDIFVGWAMAGQAFGKRAPKIGKPFAGDDDGLLGRGLGESGSSGLRRLGRSRRCCGKDCRERDPMHSFPLRYTPAERAMTWKEKYEK